MIPEAITSSLGDAFEPGLQQRVCWSVERKLGDDDAGERLAGHVDSLPEAVDSKEDCPCASPELVDHLGSRQAIALSDEDQAPALEEPVMAA